MKLSTGLRNGLLSGGSLKSLLDGGEIRIYDTVAVPASADDAIGGATLLVVIKNGGSGITFAAAAGGVMQKAPGEVWSGVNAATGNALFYRHVLSADDGSASTAAVRIQGSVGLAGADMNLSSVALTGGATQSLNFYSVAMPAG
ncbi:hypothetical protein [Variovorax sp. EBFNA2]|uniref:hypothetical protein n=1 Tax=Variovorax sp. EBFNA2 TaxID=3342097 RepID=UPI0029BFF6EE|nr:hypothetical protein [Variovorax boronicumulans]WPG35304.1 hypothetical protein RZE79_17610 [Variovorax boronicumulans]